MYYLFLQIWLWLILAFALGWFAHWFFCCRKLKRETEKSTNQATKNAAVLTVDATEASTDGTSIDESWRPQGFKSAPDEVDDLKRIKGIGAVIEETLNSLGIYQFSQISGWNQQHISWVENYLSFPGRIEREDWINQAKILGQGGSTEFAERVDKGDVDYE